MGRLRAARRRLPRHQRAARDDDARLGRRRAPSREAPRARAVPRRRAVRLRGRAPSCACAATTTRSTRSTSFGRVRLRTAARSATRPSTRLPVGRGGWYPVAGRSPASARTERFDTAFGPETARELDLAQQFGRQGLAASTPSARRRHRSAAFSANAGVVVRGRAVFAPSARELELSLGSDDGLRVFVERQARSLRTTEIDRGVGADQDAAEVACARGANAVVLKVVNTGGPGRLLLAPTPSARRTRRATWRRGAAAARRRAPTACASALRATPGATRRGSRRRYRARAEQIAALARRARARRRSRGDAATMVMKEKAEPRETFVLTRGEYDKPDRQRPVERGVPRALGDAAGRTRRRTASASRSGWSSPRTRWCARGGEPPVGVGVRHRHRAHQRGLRPAGRMAEPSRTARLARRRVPRERLGPSAHDSADGDQRDLPPGRRARRGRGGANATPTTGCSRTSRAAASPPRRSATRRSTSRACWSSGSAARAVKPYQPEGLWQEVAMLQSNTRVYERGMGDDLWRRSLYTYWKRACPPPSLLTFDAPTREFCTIRIGRQFQHAAAGAGAAQRRAVRRGRARARAAHAASSRRRRRGALERMFTAALHRSRMRGRTRRASEFRERERGSPACASLAAIRARYAARRRRREGSAAWTRSANAARTARCPPTNSPRGRSSARASSTSTPRSAALTKADAPRP